MPEGHTVHRNAHDLALLVGGPVRVTSPQGRFAEAAAVVDGSALLVAEAWGKHLLLGLGGDAAADHYVHVHLGMRGKWLPRPPTEPPLAGARLRLEGAAGTWELVAPTTCELLDPAGADAVVARLGPDPLRPDADRDAALAALASPPTAIGALLMDQTVVAGVGNVFRAEALHAVGLHPRTPGRAVGPDRLARLWDVLVAMMTRAVDDGRIVTVDAADRAAVPEAEARRVYKQERCRDCGAGVVAEQLAGRTSYHCPVEQPLPA